VRCDLSQSHRAQPDGVDGSAMELKTAPYNDDSQANLIEDPSYDTWMSSLPELSTLDYSPEASTAGITFEPYSTKTFDSDNPTAAVDDGNDYLSPPPVKE